MDLAQLRTFMAAAEAGSFLAAADVVHASPSSVTERIAALEARLGSQLFLRSRKGCTLTEAGRRFLPRARSIVEIWDLGRDEAAMPAQFTSAVRIGGQYALWPRILIPWITRLQEEQPQMALRLTAGASARLNRDLAGRVLDMAVVYSPLIGPGIESREVLRDRLVLVASTALADWRDNWVNIEWGAELSDAVATAVGLPENRGLSLDLGGMAVNWLVERQGSGFVPEHLAKPMIDQGKLQRIADMPGFDLAAHAIWRSRSNAPTVSLVDSLLAFTATLQGDHGLARLQSPIDAPALHS